MVYSACERKDETLVSAAYLHDIIKDCAMEYVITQNIEYGPCISPIIDRLSADNQVC